MAKLLRTPVLLLMAASFLAVKCDMRLDADHWQGCTDSKNIIGNEDKNYGEKVSTKFYDCDETTLRKAQTKPNVEENIFNDVVEKSSTVPGKVYNKENVPKARSTLGKLSNQPKTLSKSTANSTLSKDSSSESSSGESDSEEESTDNSDSEASSTTSDSEEGSSDDSDLEDSRKGSKKKMEPDKGSKDEKVSSKGSKFQKKESARIPHQKEEYSAKFNLNRNSDKETALNEETSRESSLKVNKDIKGTMEFQDHDEVTVGNAMIEQEAGESLNFKDSDSEEEYSDNSDSEESSITSDSEEGSSDESDLEESRKGSKKKMEPDKGSKDEKVSSWGSKFQKKEARIPQQKEENSAKSNLNRDSNKETGLNEETNRESSLKLNKDIRGPMEFQDYGEDTVGNAMIDQETGESLDFKDSDSEEESSDNSDSEESSTTSDSEEGSSDESDLEDSRKGSKKKEEPDKGAKDEKVSSRGSKVQKKEARIPHQKEEYSAKSNLNRDSNKETGLNEETSRESNLKLNKDIRGPVEFQDYEEVTVGNAMIDQEAGESLSFKEEESSDNSEESSTTSDSEEGSSDESDVEESRKGSKKKEEPDKGSKDEKVSSRGSRVQKKEARIPHQKEEYSAKSNLNRDSDKETGLNEETSKESSLKLNKDIRGPMEFQDYDEITLENAIIDEEAGESLDFKDSDRINLEDMLVELQAEGYMDFEADRIPLEDAQLKPEDIMIGMEEKLGTAAIREYNEDDDFIEEAKTHNVLRKDLDWPTKTLGDSETKKKSTARSYLRELSSEESSSVDSGSEEDSSDSSDSEEESSKGPKREEESSNDSKLNTKSRNSSKRKKDSRIGESYDGSERKEVSSKKSNFEDESEQLSLNEDSNKETVLIEEDRENPSLNKDFGERNSLNEESFTGSSLKKESEMSLGDEKVKIDRGGPSKSTIFDETSVKGTKIKFGAAPKKMHSEHPVFQDWSRANPVSVKDSKSPANTFGDSDPKKGAADSSRRKTLSSKESSSEGSDSEEDSSESDSEQESSSGESDSGQESSDEESKGSKGKGESRKDSKQTGDSGKGSKGKQESGRDSKRKGKSSKSSIWQEKSTVLKDDSFGDETREHSNSIEVFPEEFFADSNPEKISSQESTADFLTDEGARPDFFSDECSRPRKAHSADSDFENSFQDCYSEESQESDSNSFGEEWVSPDYVTIKSFMDDMFSPDYATKEGFSADYTTNEDSTDDPESEDSVMEEEISEGNFSEDESGINSDLETGFVSEDELDYYYEEDNFAKGEQSGEYPTFDDVDSRKIYLDNRENFNIKEGGNEASSLLKDSGMVRKLSDRYVKDSSHYEDEPTSTSFADCTVPPKNSKDRASKASVPETGAYCHSRDHNSDVGFAAMAPYNATVNVKRSVDKIIPKECKPQQVWMIIRAGTFSAKKAHMKRFRNKLPGIKREILDAYMSDRSNLCAQDLAFLRSWHIELMDVGPKGSLTPKGKQEIETIANNFKAAFPRLLYKPVPLGKKPSPDIDDKPGKGTRVAFAPTPQTYESAVVFLQGLYGNAWGHVGLPIRGISILQFGDHCSKYINEVLMKPKSKKPYQAFKKGKDMKGVLERVSERLGINMTVPKLRVMYNACRYQKAWNPNVTSPWCVVFTQLDLKILEYWEDLRMHFDHGHVHPTSYKQACVLAKDIIMNFRQKMAANHSAVDAIVYFINTEAIVSFTALLDLFKDPAHLRDSFNPSRLWKTSKFAGSGSNYAFVLSSCANNRWWVSATLNEAPFQLPGCTSPFGCSWDTLVRGPFGAHEKCDLSKICGSTAKNMWNAKRWHTYYIENNWM